MNHDDRTSRVAIAFARDAPRRRRLCRTSAEVLDVSSLGLTLMTERHSGPVCFSDDRAGRLDELQFSLGEGPCHDSYASHEPIFEPDLMRAGAERWPHFTPPALESGTRGLFAFPLLAGSTCIGVLAIYQDVAGPLSDDQAADGPVVAEALTQSLLTMQSDSEPDALAGELSAIDGHRAEVHQASGMVAVQLSISVSDALLRLRAHAYTANRPVADVARDIVAGNLRLDDDHRPPDGKTGG